MLDDVSASNKETEAGQIKSAVGEVPESCSAPASDPRDGAATSHPVAQETERTDCPSESLAVTPRRA